LADSRIDYVSDYAPVLESATIETDSGIVRNVTLIRAGWTQDGERYYPKTVLETAADTYGQAAMFSGHGSREERDNKKERDLGDWVSNVVPGTAHYDAEQGAVVGDVQLIKGHPEAEILARMLNDPLAKAKLGLSHKAFAVQRRGEAEGRKGLIIEAIKSVQSVDWVTAANSGGHARNATLESEVAGVMDGIKTLAEMRAAYPELVMEHAREVSTPLAEDLAAAKNRVAELEEKVKRHETADKARAFLMESKLAAAAQEIVLEAVMAGNYASDNDLKAAVEAKAKTLEAAVAESSDPVNGGTDEFGDLAKRLSGSMFGRA